MAQNFWKTVNEVIAKSDVILLVLDARMVDLTRHPELEHKVGKAGKPLMYVINKADLVSKKDLEQVKKKLKHCVFVSATKHYGSKKLREKIITAMHGEGGTVGVVGYPNVGKSSVINLLRGKGSAPTSSQSGFTKGKQLIRISQKLLLIDTPGVLSYRGDDDVMQAIIGAKPPQKVKDPELAAMKLIYLLHGRVEKFYSAVAGEKDEETLENIARARNKIKAGGVPDTENMARKILYDWQAGKLS